MKSAMNIMFLTIITWLVTVSSALANTPVTATPITLGAPTTEALSPTNQTIYYTFTLAGTNAVTLNFQHPSVGNEYSYWRVTIQSADAGTNYLFVDSPGTTTTSTRSVFLPAGTYLVNVTIGYYDHDYSNYTLTVTAQAATNCEIEKNETPATATTIQLATPYTGVIAPLLPNDIDYYRFTLDSASQLNLNFTHASNGSDFGYWTVTVQSADAQVEYLAVNIAGTATDTTRTVSLPAGTYLIKVARGNYDADYSNYILTVSAQAATPSELEPNNTTATATAINLGAPWTGSLVSDADVDYFRFTLDSASMVSLDFRHPANNEPYSYWHATIQSTDGLTDYLLLDSAGVAADTTRIVALPAGTYLVKVTRGNYWYELTTYTLTVSAQPGTSWEVEQNETPTTATPMTVGAPRTGIIAPLPSGGDVDYYSFTVPTNRPYLINFKHAVTGLEGSWYIKVVDGSGVEYLSFYSTGSDTDLYYGTTTLAAGTVYYVRVAAYNSISYNYSYDVTVIPDTFPPVTTSSPAGGIYNTVWSVTLTCSDGTQTGCDKIYYTTDGSLPTTSSPVYSSPIPLPANTGRTIRFFATDRAGATEAVNTESYVIDTILPISSASPAGSAYRTPRNVTLSCSDGTGTGCTKIYYTIDGSTPTTSSPDYRGPISISSTTTLKFFASDVAHNHEAFRTEIYIIDTIAPTTAAPPGGVAVSDSAIWTARNPHPEMDYMNGVVSAGTTIVTVGGSINPYQSDVIAGYISSTTDDTSWTEVWDDFIPYCYNNAAQGLPIDDTLNAVVSSPAAFVAVGRSGHIKAQSQSLLYEDSNTTRNLFGVTWSPSLAKFVVVGEEGALLTSPNGTTWTVIPAITSETLYGVAWSGSKFVAVGSNGKILISSIGAAWSSVTSGTTRNLRAVTWSSSMSLFVAVGDYGTVITSPDGSAWTARDSRIFEPLYGVTASDTQVVAVGNNGTIIASLDALVWKRQSSGTTMHLHAATWSGTRFVAVGNGGTLVTGVETPVVPVGTQSIILVCGDTGGAGCDKIHYTTDGSTPTAASPFYIAPITVTATAALKFFGVDKAGNSEQVKTEVYTINQPGFAPLAVTLAGSGSGSVNRDPAGTPCAPGTCTATYPIGTAVTLMATPDSVSTFGGWQEACLNFNGRTCTVAMNGDTRVTARFTAAPLAMIGASPYPLLGDAHAAAAPGAVILTLDTELIEDLTITKQISIDGGYNVTFTGKTGQPTRLRGTVTVSTGSLSVQGLAVK